MKPLKIYFKKFYYWFGWRNRRRYNYSRRMKYVLKNILFIAISVIAIIYAYNSLETLSFIGWVILLVALYFGIKPLFRLIKESRSWHSRQTNLVKIILICSIITLLFFGYQNKNVLANKFDEIDFKSKINFNDSLFSNIDNSEVKNIFKTNPERKEECQQTFNRLNEIRQSYGKKTISWDERAYSLAVARSKDMYERNYFDHVTPEGTCADTMKKDYGFNSNEWLAENCGGMSYYNKGSVAGDCDESLDGWLTSRGHRYNLLYDNHFAGTIGCYYEICVFFGINHDLFGSGCSTGDEGMAFWNSIEKQPGEV